jgi:lactate dehydrogenase-like 2-hydroxyacid dehydrogenase
MFTSSGHEIISSPEGGDAVLCLLTDKIDKKFMNAVGSQLKIVANCAVGFDNIDIETAKEKIKLLSKPSLVVKFLNVLFSRL